MIVLRVAVQADFIRLDAGGEHLPAARNRRRCDLDVLLHYLAISNVPAILKRQYSLVLAGLLAVPLFEPGSDALDSPNQISPALSTSPEL